MREFIEKIQQLKQMVQFGPGTTFAELMTQFREVGDQLAEIWPWVPFDATGDIKCTVIPTLENDPYELILVRVIKPSRFPTQDGMGFLIENVSQNITGIGGTLIIERGRYNDIITPGVTKVIPAGDLTALNYGPGLYLFRQEPAIAETSAFRFEKL